MSEPNIKKDDGTKLTRVGFVVTILSVALIFGSAVPLVRWRNPETGQPFEAKTAILASLAVGATFYAGASRVLEWLGWPCWVKATKEEASSPDKSS